MALAFFYVDIIQRNNKNCGGKGWYRIISYLGFLSTIDRSFSIHDWKYRFVYIKKVIED